MRQGVELAVENEALASMTGEVLEHSLYDLRKSYLAKEIL